MITRRALMTSAALAGTASALGVGAASAAAEPPSETTTLKIAFQPGLICQAPLYVAEELLPAAGLTDVQYVPQGESGDVGIRRAVASGEAHVGMAFSPPTLMHIEAGDPIVLLAGIHPGCVELFGNERVRTIRDLKGKTVAVNALGGSLHVFLASMAAYVGVDPRKDINWVVHPIAESMQLLAEGKIDAFLAVLPVSLEARAKKIGHVVVNMMMDRPWSQYFCCIAFWNREFVRKQPVATKRALRAILKAVDVCALQPERVARAIVDRGFTKSSDYVLQTLKEMSYASWREFDPEDTVRFYALRLHEAGLIKSSPQKIIAQGTDWRFLNELKKELKG